MSTFKSITPSKIFLLILIFSNIFLIFAYLKSEDHMNKFHGTKTENKVIKPHPFKVLKIDLNKWGTNEIKGHGSLSPQIYIIFKKEGCSNRFDNMVNYITKKSLFNNNIDFKLISTGISTDEDKTTFLARFPRSKDMFYELVDIQTDKKIDFNLPYLMILDRHFNFIHGYHIQSKQNLDEALSYRMIDFIYDGYTKPAMQIQ